MKTWLIALVSAVVVFLVGDFGWITIMSPRVYQPALGVLLAQKPNLPAAVAFYVLYLIGILTFAVAPGLRSKNWKLSAAYGALLGLVAYGTYDLTNQATLKLWSVNITLIDMGWGVLITSLASSVGCAAALWAAKR